MRKPDHRIAARLGVLLVLLALPACTSESSDVQAFLDSLSFADDQQSSEPRDPLYAKLTDRELVYAMNTVQTTLETAPSGQTGTWNDEQSGSSGSITPMRTFQTAEGDYCREYRETISTAEMETFEMRLACRTADGVWLAAELR